MIALDSNILIYMAGAGRVEADRPKIAGICELIAQLNGKTRLFAPLQALGETYVVLLRYGLEREAAQEKVATFRSFVETISVGDESFFNALDLATKHKLQLWDALILNAADEAGCSMLLSEDMQPGFKWRGVTVVDPFAGKMDRRLKRVLEG